jgi:hypothetical protein
MCLPENYFEPAMVVGTAIAWFSTLDEALAS